MTKLRADAPEAFAALREWTRVSQVILGQALVGWPMTYAKGVGLSSGLEFALRANRLQDLFEACLADLEVELGPLYGSLFDEFHGRNPLRFDSSRAARTSEVWALLDKAMPRWRYEFSLDPAVLHSTPLFQIHRLRDAEGRHWLLKVIKPDARLKLNPSISALREIEGLLRPFLFVPKVSGLQGRISDFRVAAQRSSDLRIERRNLIRANREGEGKGIHLDFDSSDVLVTADPERRPREEIIGSNLDSVLPLWRLPVKKSKSTRSSQPAW